MTKRKGLSFIGNKLARKCFLSLLLIQRRHQKDMTNFTILSIQRLLPIFSWARQGQVPRRSLLQDEVKLSEKDFPVATELIILKDDTNQLSYTSLRDLMSANRPTSPIKQRRYSLSGIDEDNEEDDRPVIKNRLVELAARAYLLPSQEQATPAKQFFARHWARFSSRNWLKSEHPSTILPSLSSDVPCLPGPLWVDLTRAFRALFSHLRPHPFLRFSQHNVSET